MAKQKKKADAPVKSFACEHCKFVGKSKAGITKHTNAQHLALSQSQREQAKRVLIPKKTEAKRKKSGTKKRTQAKKIDWDKAYAWFIEDTSRTYKDVAKQFGVSKTSVERNAKVTLDDGSWCTWAERRQMLGDEAQKKAEDEYRKSVPARNEEHLKQYRNLQIATSNKIALLANQGQWVVNPQTGQKFKVQEFDARQLADAAKALQIAINGERVVMGLATSVSTIKPGENDKGQGWGELLVMAMERVAQEEPDDDE
jgi:hypothetical protein